MFWDNPEINNDYIIPPDIPISYDNDISLFGLFINFFSNLELDYCINTYIEDVKDVKYEKAKGEEVVFEDVTFASNSYTLKETSFVELDSFISYLQMNPDLRIEIQGHTDDLGNKRDNQALSKKRAKSVFDYLSNQVNNSLTYKGYGESQPLIEDISMLARKMNRRTSFVYLENDFEILDDIDDYLEVEKIVEGVVEIPGKVVVKEVAKIPDKEVIKDVAKIPTKEVVKDVAKIPTKEVVKDVAKIPAKEVTEVPTKKVVKEIVPNKNVSEVVVQSNITQNLDDDGYPVKSDEQVILDSPFIKENAKDLIFKAIENGTIVMNDVEELLFKHAGEIIKKKHVKELIKSKR
jgi:hypothetical protein